MTSTFDEFFDVIVIGAGHAGCEAASASARLGASTALLTLNLDLIGQMSCNPAIGGIGKGHLVREIDALGGIMGRVIDRTGIHVRLLNRSRGPAVRAPRAQADRALYRLEMRHMLEGTPNLSLRQGMVTNLLVKGDCLEGLELQDARRIAAKAIVIATGTFLNGRIHTGRQTYQGGRAGEPEGYDTNEVYLNGFSTSLPAQLQQELVKLIPGFDQSQIIRPGYAIEYDFVDPKELSPFLETIRFKGLFLAGQINGTTGYEEAACQGLLAGINAGLTALGRPLFRLDRKESYIGVLVDDLIRHGVDEPYRMFTSRSEYRLALRYDNADERLAPHGRQLGLTGDEEWERFNKRRTRLAA